MTVQQALNCGENGIDNEAQEPARQGGTKLAQDVSPGWAGCRNYEPASAGDTIAWASLPAGLIVRSHPVRKSSGQGWGIRLDLS